MWLRFPCAGPHGLELPLFFRLSVATPLLHTGGSLSLCCWPSSLLTGRRAELRGAPSRQEPLGATTTSQVLPIPRCHQDVQPRSEVLSAPLSASSRDGLPTTGEQVSCLSLTHSFKPVFPIARTAGVDELQKSGKAQRKHLRFTNPSAVWQFCPRSQSPAVEVWAATGAGAGLRELP